MKVDNLIVIHGGAYTDIKKALRQWMVLYKKDIQEGYTFQLIKNGRGKHLIIADERLDNERFYYLINYLKYPEGINYKINIIGFTTGKDNNLLKEKNLEVYISPTDKEYDNVFVVTSENQNFKVDFGGKITEEKGGKLYSYPDQINWGASENITVKNQQDLKTSESSAQKLEKRFALISAVIFMAFALTFLLYKTDENFLKINYTIAFAIWGWLNFDYKILQVDKLYFGSVALGTVVLIYGYFLNKDFSHEHNSSFILVGTTMPIFFLILQRPLRFAFKKLLKREPKVERPAPSFADSLYIFILMLTTILIPAMYY